MKDSKCKCGKKSYGVMWFIIALLKVSLLIFTPSGQSISSDTYYVSHIENNYIQIVDTDRED